MKSECLDKTILFGERSLRRALREYVAYCLAERPHQDLGDERITKGQADDEDEGGVVVTERLGGLLRSYSRVA